MEHIQGLDTEDSAKERETTRYSCKRGFDINPDRSIIVRNYSRKSLVRRNSKTRQSIRCQHTAKVIGIKCRSSRGTDCACNARAMVHVSMKELELPLGGASRASGSEWPTYRDPNRKDNTTRTFCVVGSWSFNTGTTGTSKIIQSMTKLDIEFPHRNGTTGMQYPGFVGIQALSIGVH